MPLSAPSLNLSPAPTMSTSTPHVSSTIWLVMLDTQNNKYVLRTHAWRHLAILIKEFFCVRCLIEISRPTFCGPLIASWCTTSCYAISSLPSLLHYFFFFSWIIFLDWNLQYFLLSSSPFLLCIQEVPLSTVLLSKHFWLLPSFAQAGGIPQPIPQDLTLWFWPHSL